MFKYGARTASSEHKRERVLNTWLANPLLDLNEIAEKASISNSQFYSYRQNPEFMEEYKKRCRQRFNELEAKALEVLEIKLNEEDWKATQYVLDGLDYSGKTKVETNAVTTVTINVGEEE